MNGAQQNQRRSNGWSDASANDFATLRGMRMVHDFQRRQSQSEQRLVSAPPPNSEVMIAGNSSSIDHEKRLLNNTFDDIEHFSNRLHQAVQAAAELERIESAAKRGSHHQNHHRNDYMTLMAIARLPTDEETCRVLSEFKVAFNQLAKLRGYIESPSASEVARILVTILKNVVYRTKSMYTGESCASNVVAPLLTSDTISFLQYALSTDDQEYLQSLGTAWCTAALEDRNGFVPELISPPPSVRAPSLLQVSHPSSGRSSPVAAQLQSEPLSVRNAKFLREIRARNGTAAEVIAEYDTKRGEELQVQYGEVLEVLNNDRQWWKVRNAQERTGYCPCTVLRELPAERVHMRERPTDAANGHSNGVANGRTSAVMPPSPPTVHAPIYSTVQALSPRTSAPVVRSPSANESNKQPILRTPSYPNRQNSDIANDLQNQIAKNSKQPKVVIHKSTIKINQESSSNEVQEWLREKKYDPLTIEVLKGLNGKELFALQKSNPERLNRCKQEDLRRLTDHLLLEKNRSGYETPGRKQLKAMLEKQREKMERQQESNPTEADEL